MASAPQVQWPQVQNVLSASGQPIPPVLFDQYDVHIGAVQGGAVIILGPGQQAADHIRLCSTPPRSLPRDVSGFLDREQEQLTVGQALARGQVVDLHGPDGMGKTDLIIQVMYSQQPSAFPAGMVYLTARHETREDLLQELCKHFFETKDHIKVTENDVRRIMAGRRALIVMDDANHLEEGEAEALAQAVPQCALLIAGREQQAWRGVGVPLGGLPRAQAMALFERRWGPIAADQRPTVEAICEALSDEPLAIIKTASTASKRTVPLAQVLEGVRPSAEKRDPIGRMVAMIGGLLSAGERQVLGGMAAPGGTSVDLEALEAITGLPIEEISRYLARLQKMDLVHADGQRYSLDEGLAPYIRQVGVDEGMLARAADYFRRQAGQLRAHSKDPDEENVMAALGYYYQRKQWKQVIEIVRALEPYLVTTGRWGQWRRRLLNARHAAQALGDRATEAWVQNQLGIVALSLADTAAAINFFKGALSIWQALGDQGGMTIARWNLQLLLGPPPPPPREAKQAARSAGGGSALPIILGAVAAVLVIVLGVLIVIAVWPQPPPITLPPPPTTVVPPTDKPIPPWVQLWLAAGCEKTYAPGSTMVIQAESNVAGRIDVYQVNPQGDRAFLFPQDVQPGQTASQDWNIPDGEGHWALEADLNAGEPHAHCGFWVKQPTVPQVWIWLDGGCGRSYLTGEASRVSFQSTVDGQVDVYGVDPTGKRGFLFSQPVQAGQTASHDWKMPDQAGGWTLEADLNKVQTPGQCSFTVEAPWVQIRLQDGCDYHSYTACQASTITLQSNVDGVVDVYQVSVESGRELLFSQPVMAGQVASRDWQIPKVAGDMALEADLSGTQVNGPCDLRVDPESVRPVMGKIWIEPMTGDIVTTSTPGRTCPGDKVWVYAEVYDPCGQELAQVEIRARYPAGSGDWVPSGMFPVDAQTYRHPLTAHEDPGTEFYIYAEDEYGNWTQSDTQVYSVLYCIE